MTPKGIHVSGSNRCAHCGQKIWQDAQSERWYHPLTPCPVTKENRAIPEVDDEQVEEELADLDVIDQMLGAE